MRFDLAKLARAKGVRRKRIVLRPIVPPQHFATSMAAITLAIPNAWKAATPDIMAQYERALAEILTDDANSVQREIEAASNSVLGLIIIAAQRLGSWAQTVERWHRARWTANMLIPTTVDLSTMITAGDVSETLAQFLARNVALIKDVSAQTQSKISDIVFRGLQGRTPAAKVAKEIREATGFARQRTIRIASDQLQKLTSALDGERMRQAGLDQYEWQHSGKVHPRLEHKARDGKVYTVGEPQGDEPGYAPYCGCKRRPVIEI